jgi:hypothetical protein
MKTKLALICLSLIATHAHALVYLEGEDDLGNIDEEIAQVWQEAQSEPKRTVQNRPRPQYPVQETEQEELDIFA